MLLYRGGKGTRLEEHPAEGKHLIIDLHDCKNSFSTDDPRLTENLLRKIAKIVGASDLEYSYHSFKPYGITATLILSESHISIHTYPEEKKIFVDIFTCGDVCNPLNSIDILKDFFEPQRVFSRLIKRGEIK